MNVLLFTLKSYNVKRYKAYARFLKVAWVAVIIPLFCVGNNILQAQTAGSVCTIDVSKSGALFAPICRGQQIEEFNHQFQGGLYVQLVSNPSFEEVDSKVLPRSIQWTNTPLAHDC